MNSFDELGDDFSGDEANAEWDATWAAYTAGDQVDVELERHALQAVLTTPIGLVELRGEATALPSLLVPGGADLVGDDFDSVGPAVALTLTVLPVLPVVPSADVDESTDVAELDGGGRRGPTHWSITNPAGEELRAGTTDGAPDEAMLLDHIVELCATLDKRHVYLDAACVEFDGRGVLVVGADLGAVATVFERLVVDGAAYLTDRLVSVQPGTRAVEGLAFSLDAIKRDRVVDHCSIDMLLFVDATDAASSERASAEPIGVGAAVAQLLQQLHAGSPEPKLALPAIAGLVAGASCVRLVGAADDSVTELVRQFPSPTVRRMSVVSDCPESLRDRLDRRPGPDGEACADSSNASADSAEDPPLQFVRFDDTGILVEGVSRSLVVEGADADEIEDVIAKSGPRTPTPADFGLPGCPVGPAAGRLWSGTSLRQAAGRDKDVSALPTGVVAELAARDLLSAESEERGRVVSRALQSQDQLEVATTILLDLLTTADRLRIQPVVLGYLAEALDGSLPAHFIDVDRIELLIPVDQIEALLAGLENDGFVHDSLTLNLTALDGAPTVQMHHHAEPSLTIELHRTLASGPFGALVDPDSFNRSSVPVRVGDRWTRALHPAHRFVHACLRADRAGPSDLGARREVVVNAPRTALLVDDAIACSEQWGATGTVLGVVRAIRGELLGIPPPLAALIDTQTDGKRRHRRDARRAERQGRR